MRKKLFVYLIVIINIFTKDILLLHSYSEGYVRTEEINEMFLSEFGNEKLEVDYINSKYPEWDEKSIYIKLKEKYNDDNFDYIIAVDNESLEFLLKYKKMLFPSSKVFAMGIYEYFQGEIPSDFFVLYEKNYIEDNIDLIKKFDMGIKKVILLSDIGGSKYNNDIQKRILTNLEKRSYLIKNYDISDRNFIGNLENLSEDTIILHGFLFGNSYGYDSIGYLWSIDRVANRPILTFWDYGLIGKNILGGKINLLEVEVEETIQNLKKDMDGEKVKNKIILDKMGEYVFDYEIIDKYNIKLNKLPKNSLLINQNVFNYTRVKKLKIFIGIIAILLIIFFFFLIKEYFIIKDLLEKNKNSKEELKILNSRLKDKNSILDKKIRENERLVDQVDILLESTINLFRHKNEEEFMKNIMELLYQFIPELVFSYAYIGYGNYEEFIIGTKDDIKRETIDFHGFPFKKEELFEIYKLKYADVFERYQSQRCITITLDSQKKNYGRIYLCIDEVENIHEEYMMKLISHFQSLTNIFLTLLERNSELINSYKGFAIKLAKIAEAHDNETGNHVIRVGQLSGFVAEKLGLDEKKVEEIENFAPLHDVGKIYVPLSILKKKGKLTEDEWVLMKNHTLKARELLGGDSRFEVALNIALYHHEKYDGSGYPYGLRGEEIPVEAGIVAFVDIYDALRSKRSYKDSFSHEKVMDIILNGDERTKPFHFLPEILEVIKKYSNEIEIFWEKISNRD